MLQPLGIEKGGPFSPDERQTRILIEAARVGEIMAIELSAGSSSDDLRSKATLTVTGKARVIKGDERKFLSVVTVGSPSPSSSRQ